MLKERGCEWSPLVKEMKKKYRIQIETVDKRVMFCDVAHERDINEIVNSFNESKTANSLKVFAKNGREFYLIEKINKIKMGF